MTVRPGSAAVADHYVITQSAMEPPSKRVKTTAGKTHRKGDELCHIMRHWYYQQNEALQLKSEQDEVIKRKAARRVGHQNMVIQQQHTEMQLLRTDRTLMEMILHEIFEENTRLRARFAHHIQFEDLPVDFGEVDALFATESDAVDSDASTELDEDGLRERLREEREFDGF